MPSTVYYQLFLNEAPVSAGSIQPPFVVGRQSAVGEASPIAVVDIPVEQASYIAAEGATQKLVVVSLRETAVPRLLLRVDVDSAGSLVVKNIHTSFAVDLPDRSTISSSESVALGQEATLFFQAFQLRLSLKPSQSKKAPASPEAGDSLKYSVVNLKTYFPDQLSPNLLSMIDNQRPAGTQEIAIQLVRTALEAFKQPAGSDGFFDAAGAAAIKMIDLDRVAVLHKTDIHWICRSQAFNAMTDSTLAGGREFSQTLLSKMVEAGKTMIMEPGSDASQLANSMVNVDRAVASPIFGKDQTIIGALYGDRASLDVESNVPIGELEAALLDVLATGISSSLAIEQEQQLRSCMTQFFSPVVLSQLMQNQQLLDSREADVSVLFCDIRGFSAVTEKIGPTKAIAWINDILTTLSECVLNHDGVLVDYVGDELMAMFGAPGHQADHAARASSAALEMLTHIVPLGEKWRDTVPSRFGFGIGINSGRASVGNTGSKKKFKYGPLGNTVNLASRVQGITKQIGVPGLITGETAAAISDTGMTTRRLTKVRVVGIEQPIELFQLCEPSMPPDLCTRYEQALAAFEHNQLNQAAGILASLVQDHHADRPTIILLSRTVEQLTQPDRVFDPVWSLTSK
jgi:adenylate cyclase